MFTHILFSYRWCWRWQGRREHNAEKTWSLTTDVPQSSSNMTQKGNSCEGQKTVHNENAKRECVRWQQQSKLVATLATAEVRISKSPGLRAAVILRPMAHRVDSTIATVAPFLSFDTDMSPAGWQPKVIHPQWKTPLQYDRGWVEIRRCDIVDVSLVCVFTNIFHFNWEMQQWEIFKMWWQINYKLYE